MSKSTPVFKFANDLIEAYKGFYYDEIEANYTHYVRQQVKSGHEVQDEDKWSYDRATKMILEHSPKERLEVYLVWNGILGYSDRIYDIAMGRFGAN